MITLAADPDSRTVALIGNPNTGKSTLFGALSGVQQRIGNYPGVTVEKKLGRMTHEGQRWTLIDLPGTYSLAPRSLDEMVAVDVLLGRREDVSTPDVVLCVVDANNLERNLYLVSQVLELGRPTVIALTMVDVARSRGLEIDVERLQTRLGIPVVAVEAHRRRGLNVLKTVLAQAVEQPPREIPSPFPESFRDEVRRLEAALESTQRPSENGHAGPRMPRYLVERLLLDTGGYIESHALDPRDHAVRAELAAARERLAGAGLPVPAVEAMARYGWVAEVVEGIVTRPDEVRVTLGDRIDALLTHRVWGTLVLALIMFLVFHSVFTWAEWPMNAIDSAIGTLGDSVERVMSPGALRSLIVDGAIAGVGAVVIFLPQIAILFFWLAILEDCGYLARAAYLMDRLMVRIGLSGKSFIPLLSSFACAVPGVMATRVIENRRDRLTTILVAPLMSCSARLPVYALMIAAFIPARSYLGGILGLRAITLFAMYGLGILVAAVVALVLKRSLLRGAPPPFVMELPAYKWPSPRVVFHRVVDRAGSFLYRAGTIIFAVTIVMWAALYYPRLEPSELAPLLSERAPIEAARSEAVARGDTARVAELDEELALVEARIEGTQKRRSLLGRAGRWIEPIVVPLGWDWRIGSAVLASFPAREVVVATMGVIFDVGGEVEDDEGGNRLRQALREATWAGTDRPLFTIPVALSVMVFFALCAQCASTLVVIRRETNSWGWPAFCFAYMTALAYLGALATYQIGTLIASA